MKQLKALLIVSGILFQYGCLVQAPEKTTEITKNSFDPEIESLIKKMTIEEKVGQMTQINIDVISKGEVYNLVKPHQLDQKKLEVAINKYHVGSILNVGGHTYSLKHWRELIKQIQEKAITGKNGIPVIYGIDAIHGVNYTKEATLFPQQIGQAATWNPELIEKAAAITAYECRASGIPWNFSPVLDLGRQPLWSRFFETYGEDVFLAKEMTKSCIQGYQGSDPSNPHKVAACMKHFVGYSASLSGKDRTPAWIPERQLKEYYLPTFEEAIANNALTVMINSGELNGVPVHASHEILTELLRDELGFEGIAVTDWEDIIKLYKNHKVAANMKQAVKLAIDAGIDMSMTPNDYSFNEALIELVKEGEITEERLNESCRRILMVKKRLGLFKEPVPDFSVYPDFGSDKHKKIALETALESITLLKNEDILPLSTQDTLLVCGPSANSLNILNGAWTHTWQGLDTAYNTKGARTILQALKKYSKGKINYAVGANLDSTENIEETIALAKQSNKIIICLGEEPGTEIPGNINDLTLPHGQLQLVRELKKLNKPIILVLAFNRPRILSTIEPAASGIIHSYLPGDFGGEALAQLIYGIQNPSGKLPFTYPRFTGDFVAYDHKHTEAINKDFTLTGFNPQWKFGHGLSYSEFSYSNLKLNKEEYKINDTITLSIDIENKSENSGKEVIQVYSSDLIATITPSVKKLKAFKKVYIQANQKKNVTLKIPIQELSFIGSNNKRIVEKGEFIISVNGLKETIIVK